MIWRKIWGPHREGARELNHSLVKHWVVGGLFLERLLGNYQCGLVALEAYFSNGSQEVTAEYVAHRLEGAVSDDTARRRLKEMALAEIVTKRREGRTVYFKLNPEIAEAALSFMRGEPIIVPSVPVVKAS
jgi:DNA-binding transcriptional ArsR family regulator